MDFFKMIMSVFAQIKSRNLIAYLTLISLLSNCGFQSNLLGLSGDKEIPDNHAPPISSAILSLITPTTLINAAQFTVNGECEAGSQVSLSNSQLQSSPVNVTCQSNGSYTALLQFLAGVNGSEVITAQSSGLTESAIVTVDTLAPSAPVIDSPSPNDFVNSPTSFSVQCQEAGNIITISNSLISPNPTVATCSGSGSQSLSVNWQAGADGNAESVGVTLTDAVGNVSTTTTLNPLNVDLTVPTVAITTSPNISNANVNSYSFSGNCSDNGQTVTVSVGSVSPSPQPTCTGGSWNVSGLDVSSVSDSGAVAISAQTVDAAGNVSTVATASVVKDTVNPTVTINPPADIDFNSRTNYGLAGTCSESGEQVTVLIGGSLSPSPQAICTGGSWSVTGIDVSSLPDSGSLAITANHDDALGNSATEASASVIKDTILPIITFDTPLTTITASNVSSYSLSGTCDEEGAELLISVGGEVPDPLPFCTSGTWSVSGLDMSFAPDSGALTATADISDAIGNVGVQATANVVKDTGLPTVTITSAPHVNKLNDTGYGILQGTCTEDGEDVVVSVEGISPTTQPVCSSGAWSLNGLDVSSLSDSAGGAADIDITVDHDDAAGNSAPQATAAVIKDTVSPAVLIDVAPNIIASNVSSYASSGRCSESGRTVTIIIGGQAASPQPSCTAGLTWSVSGQDLSSVGDSASLTVTADHDDVVGNPALQAVFNIEKDVGVPTVSINAADDITANNVNSYSLSGSCSDDGRFVQIQLGTLSPVPQPTCSGGVWSLSGWNVSSLSDASSIAITADHSDSAGNVATQATDSVDKDTVLPTVSLDPALDVIIANVSNYSLSGNCSENGEEVTVAIGSFVPSPQPTCTGGSWSISSQVLSGIADADPLLITVDHQDAIGNNAIQANQNVTKDTMAPTVTIDAPTVVNLANVANYSLSGTCSEELETVVVTIAGLSPNPTATCSSSTWTMTALNLTAVSDSASLTILADHSDSVGNPAIQASASTLKDTSVPSVAINSPDPINIANVSSYSIAGSCTDSGREVTVSIGGVSPSPQPLCFANAWIVNSINLSALADSSTVSITADHSDVAGNTATQASASTIKDTVAPTVSLNTPAPITLSNVNSYSLSGSCSENGQEVTVELGGVSPSPQPSCAGGAWSLSAWDVSAVADNPSLSVTVDHLDVAQNPATQVTAFVVKDTSAPTVSIVVAGNINIANQGAYTDLQGNCSEDGETVTVSVGGVNPSPQPTCSGGSWIVSSMNLSGLSDGTGISVTVDHSDSVGNSATQATTTVTKDTSAPIVTIASAAAINLGNQSSYSLSGTCSENGEEVTVAIGTFNPATQPTCVGGTWSLGPEDVSSVADNSNVSITADHQDALSNSAPQATASVIKDTVLPTVAINSPVAINLSNHNNYSLSGTCSETGQIVTVSVGGVNPALQPTCVTGVWNVSGLDLSGLADSGSVSVLADISDLAGNPAIQASASVVKDTIAPTVTIDTPATITSLNEASYSLSGSCSENGEEVTVFIGALNASPQPTCTGGAWSVSAWNVSALADAVAIPVSASHSDGVSNTGSASSTVDKDTVGPNAPIGVSADDWIQSLTQAPALSFADGGGDTDHFEVAIGTTAGADDIVAWADASSPFTASSLSLTECTVYHFSVRAVDAMGNLSPVVSSENFQPDITAPIAPTSLVLSNDANSVRTHTLNWAAGSDNCSLDHYLYQVGTTAGSGDLVSSIDVGLLTSYQAVTSIDGADFVVIPETDYVHSLESVDAAGNVSSRVDSSIWQIQFTPLAVLGGASETSAPSSATNLNQSTPYGLEWSNSEFDPGFFSHDTSTDSHKLTVNVDGDYLLTYNLPIFTTRARRAVASSVFVNGVELADFYTSSTYVRNASGHNESSSHMTVLLEGLNADDEIEVRVFRDSGNNTVTSPQGAEMSLEYLTSSREVFTASASQVTGGTNLNGTTLDSLEWSQSRVDTPYTHSDASQPHEITLNDIGDYFVFVSIPLQMPTCVGNSDRTNVQIEVHLDGVQVSGGTASQGYIRCRSSHTKTSIYWHGLVRTSSANQVLTLRTIGETTRTTPVEVANGRNARVLIDKVNTSAEFLSVRGHRTIASTNWNSSTTGSSIQWDTQEILDASVFTHSTSSDNHKITVQSAGDYQVVYNDHLMEASGTRLNPRIQLLVNGVARDSLVCKSHYIRNATGHEESSCSMSFVLLNLDAGDELQFLVTREGAGGTTNSVSDARLSIWKRN